MQCQALDQKEILSIRWAHDDPNPVAKDAIEKANRDALAALLIARGISLTDAGFQYPADYALPSTAAGAQDGEESAEAADQHHPAAKRARLEGVEYPNTDAQYAAEVAATADASSSALDGGDGAVDSDSGSALSVSSSVAAADAVAGDWVSLIDETTGATYYFNAITGETSWGVRSD